jgi:hypothetical protein
LVVNPAAVLRETGAVPIDKSDVTVVKRTEEDCESKVEILGAGARCVSSARQFIGQ